MNLRIDIRRNHEEFQLPCGSVSGSNIVLFQHSIIIFLLFGIKMLHTPLLSLLQGSEKLIGLNQMGMYVQGHIVLTLAAAGGNPGDSGNRTGKVQIGSSAAQFEGIDGESVEIHTGIKLIHTGAQRQSRSAHGRLGKTQFHAGIPLPEQSGKGAVEPDVYVRQKEILLGQILVTAVLPAVHGAHGSLVTGICLQHKVPQGYSACGGNGADPVRA